MSKKEQEWESFRQSAKAQLEAYKKRENTIRLLTISFKQLKVLNEQSKKINIQKAMLRSMINKYTEKLEKFEDKLSNFFRTFENNNNLKTIFEILRNK